MVVCLSPALVDVDAVYFVGTDGNLGQGLDHMVALQNYVALQRHTRFKLTGESMTSDQLLTRHYQVHYNLFYNLHLLFVVVTGHMQNKQAITERADRDACRGKDSFNE